MNGVMARMDQSSEWSKGVVELWSSGFEGINLKERSTDTNSRITMEH